MGNIFIGKVSTSYLIGVIVLMLGINLGSIYLMEGQMLYAIQIPTLSIMVVGVKLFVRSVYKKIDGITGDILGCICELSELVYLMIIYMMMF